MNKVDFVGLIDVHKANPNGDPLLDNMPRTDYAGYGEITDVAIKRKIRNCLQDMGERILIQAPDRRDDGCKSILSRLKSEKDIADAIKKKDAAELAKASCKIFFDVRAFGQVFSMLSIPELLENNVRGPVSISLARSLDAVDIETIPITKSLNSVDSAKRGTDTLGKKYLVNFGVYQFSGSINPLFAQKTGFDGADADKVKQAILGMFENDQSTARPAGAMELRRLWWITHPGTIGLESTAAILRKIKIEHGEEIPVRFEDYTIDDSELLSRRKLIVEKFEY